MRITQRAVALTSLQGLNRNLDAVGKLQQQLTSGRLINAPSDSPTGTNKAMQTRADQAANAQQSRNITDAKSWLEQTDSTLQEMLDTARRVRDLTVQGSSTGSNNDVSAQAIATEVKSLREGLLSLANRTIGGRPLFGGVTPGAEGVRRERDVRRAVRSAGDPPACRTPRSSGSTPPARRPSGRPGRTSSPSPTRSPPTWSPTRPPWPPTWPTSTRS